MPKRTVIFAEKPSQAKAYAEAYSVKNRTRTHIELNKCSTFKNGAFITWGIGHLATFKIPGEYKSEWEKWDLDNLPIIPSEFEYKLASKDVKTQYTEVAKLFKACEKSNGIIINCTDIDREGSNIFYSILNLTGIEKVTIKRLWINSLEVEEIQKGFNNLHDNKKDILMYEEAKARQMADWLVGMNLSPLFSLVLQKQGMKGSLSIGRVQTPTVKLIYDRQMEIENFVSKPFYELYGVFHHENGIYEGKANVKYYEKNEMDELFKEYNLNIEDESYIQSVTKKEKKQYSPKLHSLSTLQGSANKQWKYSPSEVLKIVQSLYEKKIVTYPRTDSNFITESEFSYLCDNINDYQNIMGVNFNPDLRPKKRYVDNAKVEEHYALIPTKTIPKEQQINSLSEREKNIYYEILKTTLAMFHEDYVYEETTIVTNVKNLEFKTTGKVEINKGWKVLIPEKNSNNKKDNVLPLVNEKDESPCELNVKEKMTSSPKPYTQGDLIALMKTAGKHVDDDADSEILKDVEGIGTEATRAGIIERIVAQKYIEVNKNIVSVTEKGKILCESVDGTLLASPSMTAKWESYLKKIGRGEGNSNHFVNNIISFIEKMIVEVPGKIEQNVSIQEGIKSDTTNRSIDGVASCPSCNNTIVDRGKFYGCNGWKDGCKITFPKKLAGKTISKNVVKSLCEKGKTNKLKGFNGKKGKFDAALKLNDNNEIKFTSS